jgi:flagellar biosynthetic protein FlhB
MIAGSGILSYARELFRGCAQALSAGPLSTTGTAGILRFAASGFLSAFVPFAVGVMAIVLLVNLLQARGVASWKPITPKWSNVNPLRGVRRLFSGNSLFLLFKAVFKLAAIGLVTYFVIARSLPELTSLSETGPSEIGSVLRGLILRLAVLAGLSYLVLAGIDYAYQVLRMDRSLRMTRQELKWESKDTEGDPHVKSRILALTRAYARRRMLQKVPTADVVVVNPTQIAAALKYNMQVDPAPIVVAMGQRKLAERIKWIALRSNVPVVENRPVARALLATAKVGKPIPGALYTVVAEILAFVYRQRAGTAGLPPSLAPGGAA